MCYLPDEAGDGLHVHEQQADMPGSGRTIPTLAYGYASQAQGPVVIVLHAIFGPGSFERDVARRLAQAGFAVLLPDLFCREGPLAEPSFEAALARNSRHHAPRAMEDIAVIVRHLSETGRPVGLIGFCLGGTYALLAATRLPLVKASGCTMAFRSTPVHRPTIRTTPSTKLTSYRCRCSVSLEQPISSSALSMCKPTRRRQAPRVNQLTSRFFRTRATRS